LALGTGDKLDVNFICDSDSCADLFLSKEKVFIKFKEK